MLRPHRSAEQQPIAENVAAPGMRSSPAECVAPTGKSFSVLHTHWFKLKDGLIVEHRATRDDLGMSRQLGLLPPAPPRPPNE